MKITNAVLAGLSLILLAVSAAGVFLGKSPSREHTDTVLDNEENTELIVTSFEFKGVKVVIEPENCISIEKPVTVTTDSSASGKQCIEIKEGAGKPPEVHGKAVCSFSIPKTAQYRLWARRWWMDACGNSVTLMIKGKHPVIRKSIGAHPADKPHTFGDDASYNPILGLAWKWTRGNVYHFNRGSYTISILNREDGIRLDQILLVEKLEGEDDFPYTPIGIEESHIPDPAEQTR